MKISGGDHGIIHMNERVKSFLFIDLYVFQDFSKVFSYVLIY